VHADIAHSASYKKCWTVGFIEACEDLHVSNRFTDCVEAAFPLLVHGFVVGLRERWNAVKRELDAADPRIHAHKLASYHAWMA